MSLEPTHGTKVAPEKAAHGKISDVTVENITGNFGSFGTFAGTVTDVRDIILRNIHVSVSGNPYLNTEKAVNVTSESVTVIAPPATPSAQP